MGLAHPSTRGHAARQVAARAGAESFLIFLRDDEVDALLPAPGFPQTLRGARAWRAFLDRCPEAGSYTGEVPTLDGGDMARAVGIAASDGTRAVLIGGVPDAHAASSLRPLLPLLAAVFRGERAAQVAEAHAELARRAAAEARALAESLDASRRRLEALAAENAGLLEAERMARQEAEAAVRARDEFLSIASHELRTPLTAIKGIAQSALRLLTRSPSPHDRTERSLRNIDHAADRLRVLLDDLLDVSRLQSDQLALNRERLDLVALLHGSIERFAEELLEEERPTAELPGRPVYVDGDAARLEQVFDNLLSNAVKYSLAGGLVAVSLTEESTGPLVSVRDNGIGLPEGAREAIFEPFGRAANATARHLPGMGLGLYISRRIVNLHGGHIWAESAGEGRGTTMWVRLPRPAAAAGPR